MLQRESVGLDEMIFSNLDDIEGVCSDVGYILEGVCGVCGSGEILEIIESDEG